VLFILVYTAAWAAMMYGAQALLRRLFWGG
jgi:hypothetical protein